jgi:ubiquinone/menaquinone biosynthesis C-methylase UbiE/uncharacterized protein YbaR (Trm112 family)
MKKELLDILACPRCLIALELHEAHGGSQITKEELFCRSCGSLFPIVNDLVFFGLQRDHRSERLNEMNGENKWVFSTITVKEHLDYAKTSAERGEITIKKLKSRIQKEQKHQKLRVLDLGAGWGAFQSWQFAKHGFDVVATELSPEFLFASDSVAEDRFFERIVTDCTVLPFKSNTFNIILCKELVHHLSSPLDLFDEMWRVSSADGLIVVQEPCLSILKNKKRLKRKDIAVKSGIVHHYYTYNEYLAYMDRIVKDIEMDGKVLPLDPERYPILSRILKMIITLANKAPALNELILRNLLIVRGGTVELIGAKRSEHRGEKGKTNRDITPIDMQRLELNRKQVQFYSKELIPNVFKVFSQVHEEYREKD